MEANQYTEYVEIQQQRNPCLQNLYDFLHEKRQQQPCRIVCLDFSSPDQAPKQRTFDIDALACFLESASVGNVTTSLDSPKGGILIVEDLNKRIVELLGSHLDIDPMFFASHIDSPGSEVDTSRFALPSYSQELEFLNLHFHQILQFKENVEGLRWFISGDNVQRRIMVLPAFKDNFNLGLARQCCSVMMTRTKNGQWLGIILVDPPPVNPGTEINFYSLEKKISFRTEFFQGGYEDFLARGSLADTKKIGPERKSMLEDMMFYWNQLVPPTFNLNTPSLLSLGYYPLRIVAAEWVKYIEVLNRTTRHYEYSTDIPAEDLTLSQLNADMGYMQLWGRRCKGSLSKINNISAFLKTRIGESPKGETAVFGPIVQDYEHLEKMIAAYDKRLNAKLQVVTSMIQIVDARRSLKEAANVTRLTNLALLFIPMSFVTSLFGMNDGLSSHQLVLFVSVATPLCLGVLLVARFPQTTWDSIKKKMKKDKMTLAKVTV